MFSLTTAILLSPRVIFCSRLMKAPRHKPTLSAILDHELPQIYHALDLYGVNKSSPLLTSTPLPRLDLV
jgi:hypothetical protein